jgi:hypothetical protein
LMPINNVLAPATLPARGPTGMYQVDPLSDPRWAGFVAAHADASIFHTAAWLQALKSTYGYKPVAFVDSPPGSEIASGQAFCLVDSWLTGKRLVSIPFSDHAEILSTTPQHVASMLSALQTTVDERECDFVELRPIRNLMASAGFCETDTYYFHTLVLDRDLRTIYLSFHKDCVQRKIRRAERERLTYSEGRSEAFIEQFYRLLLLTAERHDAPPQPIGWFRNLATCLGESMKIRIASKDGQPVAGVITLTDSRKMIYKYAASDSKYQRCGGNALLLWTSIQDAKDSRLHRFDMGRSDIRHTGLIAFKEHWGAQRSPLNYWRYPARLMIESRRWAVRSGEVLLRYAPKQVQRVAGSLMYKHMA